MPSDILFNSVTREIVFASNGDFETTDNPSVQNGAIILEARVFNIQKPQYGIGFNSQIIGGPRSQAALQLNRWVQQIQSEGAKAKWNALQANNADFSFEADVNYL